MANVKKGLLRDVHHIQEELDLLFDHFLQLRHSPMLVSERLWRPPTDVYETTKEVIVCMEIAGMKQEEFNISVKSDVLTVKGERTGEKIRGMAYRNLEVNYGSFERNIYLPDSVDAEKVSAVYRDGFLKIVIPKRVEKLPREIKID